MILSPQLQNIICALQEIYLIIHVKVIIYLNLLQPFLVSLTPLNGTLFPQDPLSALVDPQLSSVQPSWWFSPLRVPVCLSPDEIRHRGKVQKVGSVVSPRKEPECGSAALLVVPVPEQARLSPEY